MPSKSLQVCCSGHHRDYPVPVERSLPDAALAEAASQLTKLQAALAAGNVPAAQAANDAALAAASQATKIVASTLEAKASVESVAPALKAKYGHEAGFAALETLYVSQRFLAAATVAKFFSDYDALAGSVAQVQSFLNDNRRVTTESYRRFVR